MNTIPHIKRFLERWVADPGFHELLHEDPKNAVRKYGIQVDPLEIRHLWDQEFALHQKALGAEAPPPPEPVRLYRQFMSEKIRWRNEIRETACAPKDPRFRQWRTRQMARSDMELGGVPNAQIVHAPFALELSTGCSVGCWFCGLAAPPLQTVFPYTPENSALWRGALETLKEVCGDASSHGFCYWATDPLDNPDYERFLADFCGIMGDFPQTTTAMAMKDPDRTRRLLQQTGKRGPKVNRFSILTLNVFNGIHREFSAEELLEVELVILNKESEQVKSDAGRFREMSNRNSGLLLREQNKVLQSQRGLEPYRNKQPDEIVLPATIACVSGFLINLPARTIKLISPCRTSESHPLGYLTTAESTFEDSQHLTHAIDEMIEKHMFSSLPQDRPLTFSDGFNFEEISQGFLLSTQVHRKRFVSRSEGSYMQDLGKMILGGNRTAEEIGLVFQYQYGVPVENTMDTLNMMFRNGVLREDFSVRELTGSFDLNQ